jgi:hypothetical protein
MPANVEKRILSVHVIVDVLSKDRLRKFSFGFDKTTDDQSVETWVIRFKLLERAKKEDAFGDQPVINVDVQLKTKNFPKAEITAQKGFNTAQTEATLVDVAAVSDRVKAGKAGEPRLQKAVEGVVEARDA